MDEQDNGDYVALFRGTKISKRLAKKVGFGLIFGFVGVLISIGTIGPGHKLAALVIALVFAFIGYFGLGNRVSGK